MGELVAALEAAGFLDVRIVAEFDPFLGASKERTARRHGVRGITIRGDKPVP